MTVPAGSNALSLGRSVIDVSSFGEDVPDSVRNAFAALNNTFV
jgi:hypothetical protein